MEVSGIKAGHAIITATCRKNKTTIGAFNEAVELLLKVYNECQCSANEKANFHLILTVERD